MKPNPTMPASIALDGARRRLWYVTRAAGTEQHDTITYIDLRTGKHPPRAFIVPGASSMLLSETGRAVVSRIEPLGVEILSPNERARRVLIPPPTNDPSAAPSLGARGRPIMAASGLNLFRVDPLTALGPRIVIARSLSLNDQLLTISIGAHILQTVTVPNPSFNDGPGTPQLRARLFVTGAAAAVSDAGTLWLAASDIAEHAPQHAFFGLVRRGRFAFFDCGPEDRVWPGFLQSDATSWVALLERRRGWAAARAVILGMSRRLANQTPQGSALVGDRLMILSSDSGRGSLRLSSADQFGLRTLETMRAARGWLSSENQTRVWPTTQGASGLTINLLQVNALAF